MSNASETAQKMVTKANGNTVALENMTKASKAATLGMKTLATAGNMVATLVITKLASSFISFIDSLHTTLDEQQEITNTLQGELSEVQSDISDVNSELKTTSERINELKSKGSLSFLEQEELKNLITQNDELERRNKLLTEQEENKQKEVAESLQKEFNKEYGNKSYEPVFSKSQAEDISAKREQYNELYLNNGYNTDEELAEMEMLKHELAEFDSKTPVSFEEHIQEVISAYEELNQIKQDGGGLTEPQEKELEEYREELVNTATSLNDYSDRYGIDDNVNQSWKDLSQNISETLYPAEYLTKKFDEVFNNLPKNVQSELKEMAVNGSLSVKNLSDDIITKFEKAGFSATEVVDQIRASFEGTGTTSLPDKWEALKTTDDDELKTTREELLSLAEAGRLTEETFHETAGADKFLDNINESLPETIQWINGLVSSADHLESMKKHISGISDALASKRSDKFVDSDVLNGFSAEVKGLESWEEFERLLGDSSSSMKDCQKAADRLTSEFINNNNFLANLNETNKDYYVTQLENMGISNALEVVTGALAKKKEEEALATEYSALAAAYNSDEKNRNSQITANLSSATAEEIIQLINEGITSDETAKSLANYTLEKFNASNLTIATAADCNNLYNLVHSLGVAGTALKNYAYLKSVIESAKTWDDKEMAALTIANAEQALKNIEPMALKDVKDAQNQITYTTGNNASVNSNGSNNYKSPSSSDKDKRNGDGVKSANQSKTIIDWIERRIKTFQRKFDKWLKQAETAVTSGFINKYYKKATAAAKNELSSYGRAYSRYMKAASSVGLDKKYRDKVKNGTIDIQSIKDEKLAEKIKKYQEYYDKAQEATASFVETAEKLYNLPLDKAAAKIEKFNDAIDLLDKKLDNAVGSEAKNRIIDKQTEEKKNTLDAYKEANKKTKKNLKSAGEELTKSKNLGKDDGITAKEKKKIKEAVKNGKEVDLSYFKAGSAGYNAAEKYNEALKANTKSTYDLQSAQEDYKSWISEASMQKFENIQSQYESELGLAEHGMDMVNINISKAEALGHVVSGSYYKSLMSQEQENIRTLTMERDELQKTLDAGLKDGSIKKNSEEWYEMIEAINEVNKSINEASVSAIEFRNQLRQLEWDKFDRQQDYISQIQSESDFLTDLMGSEKLFDENGTWTKYADATAGLYAVNYNAYMSQADDYAKELGKIEKELAKDPYNTDLIKRKQELIQLQQESIKNAENEKDSIKSLVSDGYSVLLDAVTKITDEYKDALSAQKDLYDYEKSIAKQTKNISTLEKQALSLEGDDSEETRAKLQKIKTELEDARNELSESEYDRWVKDQEQMLDSITSGMEEWINERLDNIDALVADVIANTNANSSEINDTIKEVGKDVGYSLTPEMEKIWNTGNGISNVVSMYGDNFETGLTTVNSTLESIRDLVQSMSDASDAEAFHEMVSGIDKDELAEKLKNSGHKIPSAEPGTSDSNDKKKSFGNTSKKADTFNTKAVEVKTMKPESSGTKWGSWFKKKKYTGNKGILNKNGSIIDRLCYLDYDSSLSARKSYYTAMGGKGTYRGKTAQNTWMLSEMKKHGFKSGGTIGSLVKGSGEDGFILARTGEEILSLDKIRELKKAFESINPVIDSINAIVPAPEFSRIADTGRNNIDNVNIEFTLPNVKNYDEFMSRMRTDRRFEGMVQNMTLGNALGRNSFNKLR